MPNLFLEVALKTEDNIVQTAVIHDFGVFRLKSTIYCADGKDRSDQITAVNCLTNTETRANKVI